MGTQKSEVRGLQDKTLIEEENEGLGEAEIDWVMSGLPSFLVLCPVDIVVWRPRLSHRIIWRYHGCGHLRLRDDGGCC